MMKLMVMGVMILDRLLMKLIVLFVILSMLCGVMLLISDYDVDVMFCVKNVNDMIVIMI